MGSYHFDDMLQTFPLIVLYMYFTRIFFFFVGSPISMLASTFQGLTPECDYFMSSVHINEVVDNAEPLQTDITIPLNVTTTSSYYRYEIAEKKLLGSFYELCSLHAGQITSYSCSR